MLKFLLSFLSWSEAPKWYFIFMLVLLRYLSVPNINTVSFIRFTFNYWFQYSPEYMMTTVSFHTSHHSFQGLLPHYNHWDISLRLKLGLSLPCQKFHRMEYTLVLVYSLGMRWLGLQIFIQIFQELLSNIIYRLQDLWIFFNIRIIYGRYIVSYVVLLSSIFWLC